MKCRKCGGATFQRRCSMGFLRRYCYDTYNCGEVKE